MECEDDKGSEVLDDTDFAAVNEIQAQMNSEEDEDEIDEAVVTDVPANSKEKISPKIKIPGEDKFIYKSTLVSLLNSCPEGKLSKDRLTRVTQSGRKHSSLPSEISSEIWNYRNDVGIHSDVAVLKKKDGKFFPAYGRVQRIIKKSVSRGKIEYRKPMIG